MIRKVTNIMMGGTRDHRTSKLASTCVVEAIDLTVVRNRVAVLCELNLSISVGEMVALRGSNGAGKSTLLKCLAGALRPNSGEVCWFGNSARCSLADRRRLGFAGHESGLYAELTARENLVFAGRMYGVARTHQRAKELLAVAGLEPFADRLVGRLSQGLRQRLAIARAVVHEPQLILLDEPFASLDARGRDWLERLFHDWRRAGRAVCFASHDSRDSQNLADRFVLLDEGRFVGDEPTHCPSTYSLRSA